MCPKCFDDNIIVTTTSFPVDTDEYLIVVKNVPCMECRRCGEITFTDIVSANLEKQVERAKSLRPFFCILDYNRN